MEESVYFAATLVAPDRTDAPGIEIRCGNMAGRLVLRTDGCWIDDDGRLFDDFLPALTFTVYYMQVCSYKRTSCCFANFIPKFHSYHQLIHKEYTFHPDTIEMYRTKRVRAKIISQGSPPEKVVVYAASTPVVETLGDDFIESEMKAWGVEPKNDVPEYPQSCQCIYDTRRRPCPKCDLTPGERERLFKVPRPCGTIMMWEHHQKTGPVADTTESVDASEAVPEATTSIGSEAIQSTPTEDVAV